MKKMKIWSGISLALLGAGSLAVIPSMLTGCSKGAHVVVDYDSINALKQKDLSIATTADAAFKEWQTLSTKDKSIDLWSELINLLANIDASSLGKKASNNQQISTFKGTGVGGDSKTDGSAGGFANGSANKILEALLSYLGVDITANTLDYFVKKKLAFDISHSLFKKTTLKDVNYNIAASNSNESVSFDTYLWSGDFKLVIKGGFAGMDLSGLTFQFKNIPLSTFHDNMSFAMCPTTYDPSGFVVFGDNSLFDAAGTKFAITIPSNYRKYLDFLLDAFKFMNWQFPSDISQLYNKPIDIPNIALNGLFGINLNNDEYGEPEKAGNFLLNSHIYEYVFTKNLSPGIKDKYSFINNKSLIEADDSPWISSRSGSESDWNTNVYFTNGSLANKFVNFEITNINTTPIVQCPGALQTINYPNPDESKLVLKADDIYNNLSTCGSASKPFNADGFVNYPFHFKVSVKEQYENFFNAPSKEFLSSSFTIRQPYNWFVGNTSSAIGYDTTLPFWSKMMRAQNSGDTMHNKYNNVFDRGIASADLLNSRDCHWFDSVSYKDAYCKSFSLVDEHSRYTTNDPNKFYYRKDISSNVNNYKISVASVPAGTTIDNSTNWTPPTWADNDYFSIIPTVQDKDLTFDIHASIPEHSTEITDGLYVRLQIHYQPSGEEKDLYTSTTGGVDIASASFQVIFQFHTL